MMGDIFSAISIILVFVTVIFDVFAKESNDFLANENRDKDKPTALTNFKEKRWKLILKLSVVLFFYVLFFWLLLPGSIEIIKFSKINLWNFDLIKTFYVLINFGTLIYIGLTFNYLHKIRKK